MWNEIQNLFFWGEKDLLDPIHEKKHLKSSQRRTVLNPQPGANSTHNMPKKMDVTKIRINSKAIKEYSKIRKPILKTSLMNKMMLVPEQLSLILPWIIFWRLKAKSMRKLFCGHMFNYQIFGDPTIGHILTTLWCHVLCDPSNLVRYT